MKIALSFVVVLSPLKGICQGSALCCCLIKARCRQRHLDKYRGQGGKTASHQLMGANSQRTGEAVLLGMHRDGALKLRRRFSVIPRQQHQQPLLCSPSPLAYG